MPNDKVFGAFGMLGAIRMPGHDEDYDDKDLEDDEEEDAENDSEDNDNEELG